MPYLGSFGGPANNNNAAPTPGGRGVVDPMTGNSAESLSNTHLMSNMPGNKAGLNAEAFKRNLYMNDTKYQRGVLDMERAGINPVVAYSSVGASTGNVQNTTPNNTSAIKSYFKKTKQYASGSEKANSAEKLVSGSVSKNELSKFFTDFAEIV